MFLDSRHVLTCSDSVDCEASLCRGTDILLADAASLLVKTIASPFSHPYHIDHLQHHSIGRTLVLLYTIKIVTVVGNRSEG